MTTNQRTPLGLVSPGNLLNITTSEESTGNILNAAKENGKSSQARNAESLYPDQIAYACAATLGEKQRKSKNNKKEYKVQKEAIIKVVCALLNSGGGIALVDIKNKDYTYTQHGLGQDIESSLHSLICNTTSENYYNMIQKGSLLYIFVKSWRTRAGSPRICSSDTGLYIRSFTSTYMANPMEVMNLIEEKTRNKRSRLDTSSSITEGFQAFLNRDYLRLDEQLEFSESEYVEFKDFSTERKLERISEVIPLYFSAFGNGAGGYLIIGVNDQSIVKGCGKEGEMSEFKDLVKRKVGKLQIVHTQQCQMDTNIFPYELHVKDVRDDQNEHSGYVIIMKIKKVCCLVFAKDPQSWILESDSNDIKQLNASDWINRMIPTPKAHMLESWFTELSLSDRPPLAKPVYIKNGNESLAEVQEKLFGVLGSRIIIKPENLYTELSRENPELGDLLEKQLSKGHGILILSRSWAVDVGLQKNRNVCDALCLATDSYPTLYTVFKEDISQEEFEYSRLTALTIKKQLVNIGCYTGKLCVIPKVLTLQKENQLEHKVITYPKVYQLVCLKDVEELLPSLLIIMLRFKSVLSDQLGNEFFNLLTKEQYELLSDCLESNRHLFVHGLPGSGKTVIALKIMERIKNMFGCSKENILYICENQPLQYYISQENVCVAVTRKKFMLEEFPQIQHIIVEEGQNFQTENGDWFAKAKAIHKASKTGIFWLFLDYFQSCHPFETGLPPATNQSKQFLNKVIRNATTIYKFMLPKMEKIISNSRNSDFLKQRMLKSECCQPVEGSHVIQSHLDKEGIVQYVAGHCYRYLKEGYSEKDIAVLCSTEETALEFTEKLARAMLKRRLNQIRNANEIMKNAIVVDSIRRFSGLERCIVFVVNPVSLLPDIRDNILVSAASRASRKLHVLYEKSSV